MSDLADPADPAGPRTLAARALMSRGPSGRSTMRGVAMGELGKLLVRIEDEAAEPYRDALRWAVEVLGRRTEGLTPSDARRLDDARVLLERW